MLELLQGYTDLRTDRDGWIELSMDGEQMYDLPKNRLNLNVWQLCIDLVNGMDSFVEGS